MMPDLKKDIERIQRARERRIGQLLDRVGRYETPIPVPIPTNLLFPAVPLRELDGFPQRSPGEDNCAALFDIIE